MTGWIFRNEAVAACWPRPDRWLAALLLLIAIVLAPCNAARAQSGNGDRADVPDHITVIENARAEVERWERIVDRIEQQLKKESLSADALQQLRETAAVLQTDLAEQRPVLVSEVARIRKLIDALGPPPKEGDPSESDKIRTEREQLNKRLADVDGELKQLDLLVEKARGALASLSTAQGIALGRKLLERTPSLFSGETWTKSARNIGTVLERANSEFSRWWSSSPVREMMQSGFIVAAVISLILAAYVAWILRRWLITQLGRDPSIAEPTYRMRVRAALAEATARTAIPIIVTLSAYGVLRGQGILFEFANEVAVGIVWAVVVLSVLYGLPRSMLSPRMPQWRLARMGNHTAWLWYKYALILAVIACLDVVLILPLAELRPSPYLQVTYKFFVDTAYAMIFLCMALDSRLWRISDSESTVPSAASAGAPLTRNRWWTVARTVTLVIAAAVPISAFAGYGVLSDFIARRMLATAGAFLIALILHGLARDLVGIFTHTTRQRAASSEEVSPLYIWTVLFLDIGLILTMAFLIVPLWGGQWTSVLDQLGWSLTGFRVGDHVFSLTDVLTGLLAFIIVIVVVRSFQHFMRRRVFQQMRMDSGVRDSLTTAIGYVGLVIAAIVAIATAGIDLSGLAIVAGALSVGVGFGLQSIVNNFLSGLILLAERPIKVGDWVQAGEHEGIVQRISVRSTEIKTFSRASVIVPNSELISNSVVNWMHKERSGRLEIPVGVGYESDVEHVRDVLLQCAGEHEAVTDAPPPYVLFMDFGDNALLFELRCYVADVGRRLSTMSELRFAIMHAFRDAGIAIPFPQRDLHIKDAGELAMLAGKGKPPEQKAPAKKPRSRPAARKTSSRTRQKPVPNGD